MVAAYVLNLLLFPNHSFLQKLAGEVKIQEKWQLLFGTTTLKQRQGVVCLKAFKRIENSASQDFQGVDAPGTP